MVHKSILILYTCTYSSLNYCGRLPKTVAHQQNPQTFLLKEKKKCGFQLESQLKTHPILFPSPSLPQCFPVSLVPAHWHPAVFVWIQEQASIPGPCNFNNLCFGIGEFFPHPLAAFPPSLRPKTQADAPSDMLEAGWNLLDFKQPSLQESAWHQGWALF